MSDIPSVFQNENESDHWISIADLMAGLMVIFMFITISYILFGLDETDREKLIQTEQATQIENLQKETEQLKTILEDTTEYSVENLQQRLEEKNQRLAQIETLQEEKEQQQIQIGNLKKENEQLETTLENTTQDLEQKYQEKREEWKQDIEELINAQEIERAIFIALQKEFKDDLLKWADILPDLTIRFKHPDILFDTDKDILKPDFKALLDDFIPRYLRVLTVFENSIEEIRIEGHTSSKWGDAQTPIEAYFKNMALSQSRTRAVLEYSLDQIGAWYSHDWARPLLTANGLSSSRLVKPDGIENPELSRRVEFKIRTKVKQGILDTLKELE